MKYSDLVRTAAAAALAVALAAAPAAARSGSGNPKVKPKVAAASAKPASAGPKAKTQAPKAKVQAPKAKAQAAKAKPTTKSAAANKPSKTTKKGTDGTPAVSLEDVADNQPAQPTVPMSKAQEKLATNEKLRNKLRSRLPRGTDPMIAAAGFKNLGQFVAAVNVSNNLGIDFNLLKGLMVDRGFSLGQAIQQAKAFDAPRATSLANAAVVQADDEIAATSLVSVTTRKVKGKS